MSLVQLNMQILFICVDIVMVNIFRRLDNIF
jgi:hypothetical protein